MRRTSSGPSLPRRQSQPDFNKLLQPGKGGTTDGNKKVSRTASLSVLKEKTEFEELIKAIQENDFERCIAHLDSGAEVNQKDDDGWSPLIWAACEGVTTIGALLCHRGATVDLTDESGATALSYAACYGQVEMGKLLILNGANVNAEDNAGATALICAAKNGHCEIGSVLMDHGAKVNHKTTFASTALTWAACNGHTPFGRLLLDRSADLTVHDNSGASPLIYAAKYGHTEMGALLLQRGANVNDRTTAKCSYLNATKKKVVEMGINWTPLMAAAFENKVDFVRLLLEHRPDVTAKNDNGKDALQLAESDAIKKMIENYLKTA